MYFLKAIVDFVSSSLQTMTAPSRKLVASATTFILKGNQNEKISTGMMHKTYVMS